MRLRCGRRFRSLIQGSRGWVTPICEDEAFDCGRGVGCDDRRFGLGWQVGRLFFVSAGCLGLVMVFAQG
jgi:hypothetical protein